MERLNKILTVRGLGVSALLFCLGFAPEAALDFTQVNTSGFGSPAHQLSYLFEFEGRLYVATENAGGFGLFRLSEDDTWSAAAATGFRNANNRMIGATALFSGAFYRHGKARCLPRPCGGGLGDDR